jgi:hypothetical protein
MKINILLFYVFNFLFVENCFFSQDSINLIKKWELEFSENMIWTVDNMNQIYVAENDLLKKYSEDGNLLFNQSLKSFGKINEIDAKNPMKIMLFSEQQQYLFFLDNTLSKQNDLDLEKFDLNYVTHVSASIQADKIWVFDQQNSKINLIATKQEQSMKLDNIAGLLELKNISRIFETEEIFFLIDNLKGVYMFDLFGTLINSYSLTNFLWLECASKYLYVLKNDELEIFNLENAHKRTIKLPIQGVIKFQINQNQLILQSINKLYKFEIKIL